MMPFWLLPLGFYVLSRGKTKKYSTPVTSRTGLILTCSKIEIVNRETAFNLIDSKILEYCEKNRIQLSEVNSIEVFKYCLSKINPKFFVKLKSQKLSQKEKIILGILFTVIFNRILSLLNNSEIERKFIFKFESREEMIIHYLIGLSNSDLEDLEVIENRFRVNYSYP